MVSTGQYIRLSKRLLVFISVVALLVLAGWAFDIAALRSITPAMTPMNPLTAVCFILSCICLSLFISRKTVNKFLVFQWFIALVLIITGLSKFLEYLDIYYLKLDRIIFADKLGTNAIAPNTALLFFLAGILFLNLSNKSAFARQVNDYLKITGFAIAYFSIIGYVYSIKPAYQIGPFVPMALNTAFCFIALFIALFLSTPKGKFGAMLGSYKVGGRLARRTIPLLLILPPAFGYIRLAGERAGLYETEFGTALYAEFFTIVLIIIIYQYAVRLNKNELEKDRANQVIADNEEKYRKLVDTMKEGVIYFDMRGRVSFCNQGFFDMTGYSNADIAGKNIIEILVPVEAREAFVKKLKDRSIGVGEDYEAEIMHKQGHKVWLSITSRPISNSNEELTATFATVTDITERKKHIDDLSTFSASAAHDLGAPLSRIQGLSTLLEEQAQERLLPADKEYIILMNQVAADAQAMLKDLLGFAKVSAAELKKQEINLEAMVAETVLSLKHMNPKAVVNIGSMPVVMADIPSLKQVWANLVSNALKYSSKTEAAVINIGCKNDNGHEVFYIADNGAGFDMDKAFNLFAPFNRMHLNFEGNGLGLPIVKRIIEKHGGRIWAEAKAGEGATFLFTL